MRILLTTDNCYVPHAATLLASILTNSPENNRFILLYCDLNEENRNRLQDFVVQMGGELIAMQVDPSPFASFPARGHITRTAYLRMLASEYIQDDQVLYLDTDIVVLDSLIKLQKDMPPGDFPVWAVEEAARDFKLTLGFPPQKPYFNSGCLVLNLKKWRQESLSARLLERSAKFGHTQLFHDQDTLNYVIDGHFGILPPRWNVNHAVSDFEYWDQFTQYSRKELKAAAAHPGLVHYTYGKPWRYGCCHPYAPKYWTYRSLTPWPQSHPTDFSLEKFYLLQRFRLRHLIKRLLFQP